MLLGQRPPFPTYLLPSFSFPFRRRQSASNSETAEQTLPSLSSSPTSFADTTPGSSPLTAHFLPVSPVAAGVNCRLHYKTLQKDQNLPSRTQREHLSIAQPNTLRCGACSADIAFTSQIVSKGFTGRHGRAYLVAAPPRNTSLSVLYKNNEIPIELINTKIGRSVNRELLTGAHVVADVSCVICGTVLGWKYVDAKEPSQKYKIGKFILETKRVVVGVCWEDGAGTEEDDAELHGSEGNNNGVIVFDSEDEDECDDLFAGVWDPDLVAKRRARRVNTRKKIDSNG